MEGTSSKRGTSSQNTLSNYKMVKEIGEGAFAKVQLAVNIITGLKVAIKILDLQSKNASDAKKVRQEINILRLFSDPRIVHLYEVIETRSKIYVVMEYINSGDLYDYTTVRGRLSEDEARHFFQQIISGVECCHLHMVVHRDLKLENLLLDSKHNVIIADFGLSDIMHDGHFLKTGCGSPHYTAPEVLSGRLYAGPEVDVWSCGVILYVLLCGMYPFDGHESSLYAKIKSGIYSLPNHLSPGARDLIKRILVLDPISRLSIPEVRQHPWFQQHLPRDVAMHSTTATPNTNNAQAQAHIDSPQVYLRSPANLQRNWTLGFQSQASPHKMMTHVLKVLQKLHVRWKEIGHYNMKCLWLPVFPTYSRPVLKCGPSKKSQSCGDDSSITSMSRVCVRSQNAVKFEIQLYKASGNLYVLDLQRIDGSPFLFLEVSAAFLALVVA
ncbi:SNF1-related protein kinase catalytic subunit alpha KIN10-like isoform X2 [Cornus florida]|nr:SNF1-related protein kinase catalytic subunit alpha KIN10-like isoform X2 [Cornus florida]XP_059668281.1 SNF1-related protein kinase catalytic subunit alpha KIN10-like isoform X2 [Cornus florida]XP_059668283.1 SNF1-related protein kinase catalytic subunit alpha KIN10-like isoform X2 [Cornus florida]